MWNSEQANHGMLRESSELEGVGGWSIRVGDCACLLCCYSWVSMGAAGLFSPAVTQLEGRSFLHTPAAPAFFAHTCVWTGAEEGPTNSTPL